MAVITFPSTLYASQVVWGQQRNDAEARSVFGAQAFEGSAPLWRVSVVSPDMIDPEAGAWKSLVLQLRGRRNQLELWDIGHPAPAGTMRGSMAFNATAAAGAVSIQIVAAGEAGKTLLQGDLLGFGTGLTKQVVMVTADATADGTGAITVSVEPPLRNAFSSPTSITWDKPTALFRQTSSGASWDYKAGFEVAGITLDLLEDVRP